MLGKAPFVCKRGTHEETEQLGTDDLYALKFIETQTVGMLPPFRIIARYLNQILQSVHYDMKEYKYHHACA